MDSETMCEKKYQLTTIIQELFDEYNRNLEVHNQYKCENELSIKNHILTTKKQESIIKEKDLQIKNLEIEQSKKNKQLHEYEGLIRDLEDKINLMNHEKEEEGRFDILRVQANTIYEKEKEIERLNDLLNKKNTHKNDKKINNVLDLINSETNIEIEIENKSDNELDNDKESNKDNQESSDADDDDYEILTYRKKEYWIKKGQSPQYVYEVLDDDCLGDKLGIYKEDNKGKLKVFLDKR